MNSSKQFMQQNSSIQINLLSPKSQPRLLKSQTPKKQLRKSIHRQIKKRKQQSNFTQPLLITSDTDSGINSSLQLQSINQYIQDSQQYLKVNKVARLINQGACQPSQQSLTPKKLLFTPQQNFIIFLNVATICVIYLYFTEIPISIAFQNHREEEDTQRIFQYINIPALIIFILGSIIKARTAYFSYGILITDQKMIVRNYFKTVFFIDLLSIGSIIIYQISEIFHQGPIAYRFIILLFYLKVGQLVTIQKYLINFFDMNRRVKASLKLSLLLTKIFMLCNIFACGFFYLSDNLCRQGKIFANCQQCCWTTNVTFNDRNILQLGWDLQYVYSLYWASTTMISIGYGDITPRNSYQIIYTVFVQFASCLVYAYSLNTIWEIIQQLNSKKLQIRHRITAMSTYCRDKNINPNLKSKINAYLLHFYHTMNIRQKQLQKQIINQLSPSLKKQLYFQAYGFMLHNHSFFKNFTSQMLQKSSQRIIQSSYFQKQTIYSPYCSANNSLYYILQGEVQNYIKMLQSKLSIRKIYFKQIIGLSQFVTQLNYKSMLVANLYSVVYQLKFQHWKQMLQEEDKDFQMFYQISHQILFGQQFYLLDSPCEFCRHKTHLTQECFHHQIAEKTRTFLKRYKEKQERKPLKRQNIKSAHFTRKQSLKNDKIIFYQNKIGHSIKKNRKISLQLFPIKKQDSQHHIRSKRHIHKREKLHCEYIDQIKHKFQRQGQDFQQLYSQDSLMLSTDNIIDKVQNYDYYFPKYNADQEAKTANPKRRETLLRLF